MNEKVYAVITGDIVGSTRISEEYGTSWINCLSKSLRYVGRNYQVPFSIYRGDSFQGMTSNPELALRDAICLRLMLISGFEKDKKYPRLDARIAIGIGNIDPTTDTRSQISEMEGEAFINSGRQLDKLKNKKQNLSIKSPWPDLDCDLDLYCMVADRLIKRWTKKECEAIMQLLEDKTQEDAAKERSITRSALAHRLSGTDYDIIVKIIERFSESLS